MSRARFSLIQLALLAGVLGVPFARAEAAQCPEPLPADARERRVLAKSWFADGEAAVARDDPKAAIQAFSCSLRLVPHARTAYNVGVIAEKMGDLEIAVTSYRSYVTLAPEAQDASEIQRKIQDLERRLSVVRGQLEDVENGKPDVPRLVPPPPPAPPHLWASAPPPARPAATPWVVASAGIASLAAGVVLNLHARALVRDCHDRAYAYEFEKARAACDAAGPWKYASYGAIGLAGAAAVFELVELLGRHAPGRAVEVSLLPAGALVSARIRL